MKFHLEYFSLTCKSHYFNNVVFLDVVIEDLLLFMRDMKLSVEQINIMNC